MKPERNVPHGIFSSRWAHSAIQRCLNIVWNRSEITLSTDLFDWGIGFLMVVAGLVYFMFNFRTAGTNTLLSQQFGVVRVLLILYGLMFVLSSSWKTTVLWKRCITLAGAGILAWLAAILSVSALSHGTLLYGSLALVFLLNTVFPRLSFPAKVAIFSLVYISASGIVFLLFPERYAEHVPTMLEQYRIWITLGWVVCMILALCAFVLVVRGKIQLLMATTVLGGVALLITAVRLVPYAVWDRVCTYVTLGLFLLLFPFWKQFAVSWKEKKANIFAELLFMVTLILVSGLVLGGINRVFFSRHANADLSWDAKYLASGIRERVRHSQAALGVLSDNPQFLSALRQGDNDTATALLRDLVRSSDTIMQALLLKRDGEVMAYYPPTQPNLLHVNFAFRDYFQGAMAGKPYVSEALFQASIEGSPWIIGISVPVRESNGNVVGVIAARPDLYPLEDTVVRLSKDKSVLVTLFDSNGRTIVTSKPEGQLEMEYEYHKKALERPWEKEPVLQYFAEETLRSGSRPNWLALVPVEDYGWYVAVERSVGGVAEFTEGIILLLMFAVLLAGLFGIVVMRERGGSNASPIYQNMERKARRL